MRIMFAWELGGGLGHLARLSPWLREFAGLGATPILAARDLAVVARVPGLEVRSLLQAPLLLHGPHQPGFEAGSYPELLLEAGYGNADTLGTLVRAWRSLFQMGRIDALVADYAPTAMLAARVAGIPALHVGDGFTIPPADPGAAFATGRAGNVARFRAAHDRVVACADHVIGAAGATPLPSLDAMVRGARTVLATYPELDHYRGSVRDAEFAGHFEDFGSDTDGWRPIPGPRILAYLKPTERQFGSVIEVLRRLPVQTRIYASGMVKPQDCASGHGVTWSASPIAFSSAVAAADLVISHAGHGTTCCTLLAGKPLCMLPTVQEQMITARNVVALGAGALVPPAGDAKRIRRQLERCIEDSAMRVAAAGFAERHAGLRGTAAVRLAETADRFLALVKNRGAA